MGIFSFLGNLGAGIQGARLGKKQMALGQGMIDEAQSLSAAYQRPELQTPQAIKMMMDMSQGRMYQNMPGMGMMQNQIDKATAGAVSNLKEMGTGSEAFGAIANIHAANLGQQSNLATQNAQYRDQNQTQYMDALGDLGQWQQMAWQWNEADPYLQAQQKAAQLETMGRSGQWEGLKTKMGSWAESFQGMGGELDSMASQAASAFIPGGSTFASIAGALTG
jgi:hypothetical protein